MRFSKLLTLLFLSTLLYNCGDASSKVSNDFFINTNTKGKNHTISNNETLELSIQNSKNHPITSVDYTLDGRKIDTKSTLNPFKLGRQVIKATVHYGEKMQVVNKTITILNHIAPKVYTFNILNEYSHDIKAFTQGLEFHNGELYESTGQRKESQLRKVDYKTGKVLKSIDLADEYFGEGITVLNDNVYQLTWEANIGFVYDKTTFEKKSSFKYGASTEGWGLCNDGDVIYKSDGTEKIWVLDPETLIEKAYIQAFTDKGKIGNINELEWVNGKIYANRWQKNGVAIINPINGAIDGVIDFNSLAKKHKATDFLNGVAYNSDTKTLFVTGKNWDTLYEVEIVEK